MLSHSRQIIFLRYSKNSTRVANNFLLIDSKRKKTQVVLSGEQAHPVQPIFCSSSFLSILQSENNVALKHRLSEIFIPLLKNESKEGVLK